MSSKWGSITGRHSPIADHCTSMKRAARSTRLFAASPLLSLTWQRCRSGVFKPKDIPCRLTPNGRSSSSRMPATWCYLLKNVQQIKLRITERLDEAHDEKVIWSVFWSYIGGTGEGENTSNGMYDTVNTIKLQYYVILSLPSVVRLRPFIMEVESWYNKHHGYWRSR